MTSTSGAVPVIDRVRDPHGLRSASGAKNLDLATYLACLEALRLRESGNIDRLISYDSVRDQVAYHTYQLRTALRVLRELDGRALLADEVGLGKTIEAGLIIKELIVRNAVESVLCLVPKSLIAQWRDEMRYKFGLEFTTKDEVAESRIRGKGSLRLVVGHASLSREASTSLLSAREWDIVVVDEAHKFCNSTSNMNRALHRLPKKRLLLLTATPLQNNLKELFQIVDLLRPGLLAGSEAEFVSRYAFDRAGREPNPRHLPALRHTLRETMCRTRRAETDVPFVARVVDSISVTPGDAERRLIELMYAYCAEITGRSGRSSGLSLETISLHRALCSHPAALEETLRKRTAKDSRVAYAHDEILSLITSIDSSAKEEALFKALAARSDWQSVIFVERLRTGQLLKERLAEQGRSAGLFHGQLGNKERSALLKGFSTGAVQHFISTGAGAEGLNLQHCHFLVNFDLHWNPLKIEQRIGRVHRFGQDHDVAILNLSTKDTIDDHVVKLLFQKINLFQMAIGEIDAIISEFGEDHDIERQIEAIVSGATSRDDVVAKLRVLGDKMKNDVENARLRGQFSAEVLGNAT